MDIWRFMSEFKNFSYCVINQFCIVGNENVEFYG